jgi:hypothetical protein
MYEEEIKVVLKYIGELNKELSDIETRAKDIINERVRWYDILAKLKSKDDQAKLWLQSIEYIAKKKELTKNST